MKYDDKNNKVIKSMGFADFETYHQKDFEHDRIDVRVVGNELHVFKDGKDTGERPTTWIKCGCMIYRNRDGTREEIGYLDTPELFFEAVLARGIKRVYFHNMKFDVSFLIDKVMRGKELKRGHYIVLSNGWRVFFDGERDVMAGGMGALYKVTFHMQSPRQENGNYRNFTFDICDSAKIWAGKLAKLGKDFGFPKGDEALRVGCDDVLREYCMQDCRIVETIMFWYFDKMNELTRGKRPQGYLTAGSTAINLGMMYLHNELMERHPEFDEVTANKMIGRLFPKLDTTDNEQSVKDAEGNVMRDSRGAIVTRIEKVEKAVWMTDENGQRVKTDRKRVVGSGKSRYGWFRNAYKGATPLLDRARKSSTGYISRNGKIRDVNSMHPTQIVKRPMPYGEPIESIDGVKVSELLMNDSLPEGYTFLGDFRIKAHVKKGHRATIIQKKGKVIGDDMEEAKCIDTMNGEVYCMCQPEYEMMFNDYDVYELEVVRAVAFKTKTGVFKNFLMYWYDIKTRAGIKKLENGERNPEYNPALKAFAKLIINSFYGKFGTNPFREDVGYELDKILKRKAMDCGADMDMDFYLPMAIWTTAYSRKTLSDGCNAIGWEHVIYTDTDSWHVEGLSDEEINARLATIGVGISDDLGDAKPDGEYELGLYIRNKGYAHFNADGTIAYDDNGNKDIKMGGANIFDNINCIDDVMKGVTVQRLMAYSCVGGIVLWPANVKVNDEGLIKRARKVINAENDT